jgi:hypothetical protein
VWTTAGYAVPREDFREAREGRRREREAHLRQRRVSGEELQGGRSRAQIPVASDSGLVETPNVAEAAIVTAGIAPQAVNEFLGEADDNHITTGAYDANTALESLDVIGTGATLLITFLDEIALQSTGIGDGAFVNYTMTVTGPGGTFSDPVFGSASLGHVIFQHVGGLTLKAQNPHLVLIATLEDRVEYTIDVTFRRSRNNAATDDIFGTSTKRRLFIQEVKR